jgi:hypothetical protein
MKLRIRGDSVRFRLAQGEVRALVERGRIEERTRLGPRIEDALTYALELSDVASAPTCTWQDGRLAVALPRAKTLAWATGSEISLEATQPVAGDATLRILVEKDLACVTTRPGEDDRDAYPNPTGCVGRT